MLGGRVLLHKKSLGHPAKAQNPNLINENIKPSFRPRTKPLCPRGGPPEPPTYIYIYIYIYIERERYIYIYIYT